MLAEELQRSNIMLSDEQCAILQRHLNFVVETNTKIKLTAITRLDEGARKHVADSLLCLPEVDGAPAGPLLDLGSGGGYPGIPLAVATGRRVDLLDAVKKKMQIIQEFIDSEAALKESVRTLPYRAESWAEESPESYAAVVARAVAPLPSLVELAAPLMMDHGTFIGLKGKPSEDEIERGHRVADEVGLEYVSLREYTLSEGEERCVVCYRKVREPKRRLPRRTGLAQHRPLA
ncbi:MAG: 16S rRNA (guanine(527)-N(7))-methyltransferase RsmG [Actinomycetes bacterium]|nr:16S rRNA (guanine(527)-N(7))-methyltransferase RsmG [Actinomycetes bacterium]